MAQVNTEVEFDELYDSRRLNVVWRMTRCSTRSGSTWTLISASVCVQWMQVELFIRQDQPHAPAHIRKLSFRTEEECDDYLLAKRLELASEGWHEEQHS